MREGDIKILKRCTGDCEIDVKCDGVNTSFRNILDGSQVRLIRTRENYLMSDECKEYGWWLTKYDDRDIVICSRALTEDKTYHVSEKLFKI